MLLCLILQGLQARCYVLYKPKILKLILLTLMQSLLKPSVKIHNFSNTETALHTVPSRPKRAEMRKLRDLLEHIIYVGEFR